MTETGSILVLAAEPDQAAEQAARLRAGVTRTVHATSLRDEPPVPNRGSWLRRRRQAVGESSNRATTLAALCRENGVTVVVACDDESARTARAVVDKVPDLLALFGVDAAVRALSLSDVGPPPGGSPDDVLGRTRFVGDAATDSTSTGPVSSAPRLVIGPDNWDGRAAAWALVADPSQSRAIAVQVVDGGDFRTAPADLSISRAEWSDPGVGGRFSDAVAEGTTHVLQVGAQPLLPAAHVWPGHVTVGMVLDAVDLTTTEEIDALVGALPSGVDGSRVTRWKARTGRVARRLAEHEGSIMVTDRALVPRVGATDVLPLAVPAVATSASAGAPAGAPPLVVTARPDPDLGVDPAAEIVRELADDDLCRHLSLTGLSQSMWLPAIRAADVVVDPVWLPGLGMAGVIGLAVGRTVITGGAAASTEAGAVQASLSTLSRTLDDVLAGAHAHADVAEAARTAEQRRLHARQALGRFVAG